MSLEGSDKKIALPTSTIIEKHVCKNNSKNKLKNEFEWVTEKKIFISKINREEIIAFAKIHIS